MTGFHAKLSAERYVVPLPQRDDTGGTADAILDASTELEVVDYKHGRGVYVPVEDNKQTLSYLLGAVEAAGWRHRGYRHTIIQPRHPQGGVESQDVTPDALKEFQRDLALAAKVVDNAREHAEAQGKRYGLGAMTDYMKAGDHCIFCPLKAECPIQARMESV